ncbi:MAG: DEAD/DEAH box helicase family protein [Candidatus Hydrogenedentes bacterium]|nr:DEAD/DEAH box helicase family protein [Candidatus Hydrogenedentota bacterium]
MNPQVNTISNRLSLRAPQREALEILDRVCDFIPLQKGGDVGAALDAIRPLFPSVADFERDFPSLCFALATGVGKTRLMGAFISYLHRVESIRHFFVLAPNLTIYGKLIADFTPNTPKYVFQGISEFATTPPVIITGDTYEQGIGVRDGYLFEAGEVHVNIFNISKITGEMRGGSAPRIKRLSEYIGESYFEYLSKLDDLVLIMDESHRYRAAAGMQAINDLNPVLGLELTATPFIQAGQQVHPFQNTIYSYPLSCALSDGFVKEPAVATRENFQADNYDGDGLERLKLEDGIRFHENTKVELEVYARENSRPIVKPFMLVVAQDTGHADALVRVIEDDGFFEGRYRGRVITVHSNLRGEERDETVQQLLSVEDRENPVEIVVHVNMLKEGWDVTNLYTIVPLRAANARTLVEQSIGRGLRLPYGKRTGNPAVDRLTIVSHDRFQEIIDHANDPHSVIRTGIVIGRDVPDGKTRVVVAQPTLETQLLGGEPGAPVQGTLLFARPEERQAIRTVLNIIRDYERLPRSADLQLPEVQLELVARAREVMTPAQYEIAGTSERVDLERVVRETAARYVALSIDIPRIVVVPRGAVTGGFRDFDLDTSNVRLLPVATGLISQGLHDGARYRLTGGDGIAPEDRLEDYLVRGLIDFDDVNYDENAELLYKLAGQMVRHLHSYLKDDDEVLNVLQHHQQTLVNLIHAQMQNHYEETAAEYEAKVSKGFTTIRETAFNAAADEEVRNVRAPVADRQNIRRMLFGGFQRCLYSVQKFDADSERRFAVILETDPDVLKWFKPSRGAFEIHYGHDDAAYNPDFVVETQTAKFICEPKAANEMADETVLAKARAAAVWCQHATKHAETCGGKPWAYLLIPDSVIQENMTLQGLAAAHTFRLPG